MIPLYMICKLKAPPQNAEFQLFATRVEGTILCHFPKEVQVKINIIVKTDKNMDYNNPRE